MTTTHVMIAGGDVDLVVRIGELLGDPDTFALIHRPDFDAALNELAATAPEVCLVIHELDGLRGIELIGRAIGAGCEAPLILLRHGGDADIDRHALAAGATDSLVIADLTAPMLERAIRHGGARRLAEGQRIALVREQLARQKAEAINRAKDEFLATLSHELRTPLNAMLGWAQLLHEGQLDEKTRATGISAILRSGRAQASLIEELLDVTRLLNGKLTVTQEPVLLPDVIEAACEVIRPDAVRRRLTIRTSLSRDTALVLGDAGRLQQVVGNLLANAVKFTPEGGHIDIDLVVDENEARIVVQDDGPGIAAELLPHVFNRFRQDDSSTTREHGGLGLGLAIALHIVLLHGGTLVAGESERRGARFEISLPLARASDYRGHPSFTIAAVADYVSPKLEGIRVLLVEDDDESRDYLRVTLELNGAIVRATSSAAMAWLALADTVFDVMLSDIAMPVEDGHSLARRLRLSDDAAIRRLPAAALSAHAGADDRERAITAGFQAHLAKPIEPRELLAAVAGLTATGT